MRSDLLVPLDQNIGAEMRLPWYRSPAGTESRRFDMANGDIALFCWRDGEGYWIGNTETPSALWRTDKAGFDEVPRAVADWAERELLAHLFEEVPWLADYPVLAHFFLPVLLSKDGRHTAREFLGDHGAGFPGVGRDEALSFYESFLETGELADSRYEMAAKLGTSESLDLVRMSATMSEFNVAKLLADAGYELTPEIEVTTGHSIDFRVDPPGSLVEVTRPLPPSRRSADSPITALRETANTKTTGQLKRHGGGVVLFVDCSSFPEEAWSVVRRERPSVGHRPAVVFRMRPGEPLEGYADGSVPFDLPAGIET